MPGPEPVGPMQQPRHEAAPSRWRPLQPEDRRGGAAGAVRGEEPVASAARLVRGSLARRDTLPLDPVRSPRPGVPR
jgi:hypothetical protein